MFQIVLVSNDNEVRQIPVNVVFELERDAHTTAQRLSAVTSGEYKFRIIPLESWFGNKMK